MQRWSKAVPILLVPVRRYHRAGVSLAHESSRSSYERPKPQGDSFDGRRAPDLRSGSWLGGSFAVFRDQKVSLTGRFLPLVVFVRSKDQKLEG